jgi:hypothetical protein
LPKKITIFSLNLITWTPHQHKKLITWNSAFSDVFFKEAGEKKVPLKAGQVTKDYIVLVTRPSHAFILGAFLNQKVKNVDLLTYNRALPTVEGSLTWISYFS